MDPITIEAIDDKEQSLFVYSCPSSLRLNVQSILDQAFAGLQSAAKPDPFRFSISYFGYSKDPAYPGYLGYEIESINDCVTSANAYWSLSLNDQASDHGIDTTFPGPADKVMLRFVTVGAAASGRNIREKSIIARRLERINGPSQ
jgi:hypothetical protein